MKLICKNLKISVRVKNPIDIPKLEMSGLYIFEKRLTFSLRECGVCFTMYKHSRSTLHITGIRKKQQIISIFDFIKFVMSNVVLNCHIDNSLFSYKNTSVDRPVNFGLIMRLMEKNERYVCSHTPEIFPALFLKPKALKQAGVPTILLFTSGSVVLLGGKTIEKISSAVQLIKNLINQ